MVVVSGDGDDGNVNIIVNISVNIPTIHSSNNSLQTGWDILALYLQLSREYPDPPTIEELQLAIITSSSYWIFSLPSPSWGWGQQDNIINIQHSHWDFLIMRYEDQLTNY